MALARIWARGGMATKLQAADIARRAGIEVIIAAGHQANVIESSAAEHVVGTRFKALTSITESRKQWLLSGPASSGDLVIDLGAMTAVVEKGSSLLVRGITRVEGQFNRGAMVQLKDHHHNVIARGIVRYSADELAKIEGLHSEQINQVLGYDFGAVVIHRDDLVVLH